MILKIGHFWGVAYCQTRPCSFAKVYPLVNIQKVIENCHRHSGFSQLENGDFFHCYVSSPEAIHFFKTTSFNILHETKLSDVGPKTLPKENLEDLCSHWAA